MNDFRYLENRIHEDDMEGLMCATTRVVLEVYPRRGANRIASSTFMRTEVEVQMSVKRSTCEMWR